MKNLVHYPASVAKYCAPIKTVNLRVDVMKPNLPKAVQAAFEIAKSGGAELNLTFTVPSSTPSSAEPFRSAAGA